MHAPVETTAQSAGRRLGQLTRRACENALVGVILAYRFLLSPWLGQHCRFHPTCSCYALESIRMHGPLRGTLLSARRLLRCHPWHEGGIDPVPHAPHASVRTTHSSHTVTR